MQGPSPYAKDLQRKSKGKPLPNTAILLHRLTALGQQSVGGQVLTTIELPLLVGACGLHKPAKDTRCKSAHLQLSSLRHILLFGKKRSKP